ncbi:MAG: ATP-dependent DNA helicase [Melioribacteraceae bacterium]|nr:ATP-dependent DNA helicase [Melioribacteraceae bacterium]
MTIKEALDKYFGFDSLKPVQEEIINEILNKKNVLAILPTGAGKSLCYQIPAIVSENFSIVISPLIALMKDQVDSLNKKEKVASFINSTLDDKEIENVFNEIQNLKIKLLYVSPEKLQNNFFVERIRNLKPTFLFVDEAHCISEWGHNFRPSYLKIKSFIDYCDIKNISAFTATATEEVRDDIINLLELKKIRIFVKGFERVNLSLNVFKNVDKKIKLLEIINNNQLPAIVYTSTRKHCEDISEFLRNKKFNVSYYHAGLSSEIKKIVQDDFLNNKTDVIVATNAFGMGIDKNNIRTIIHYNMPGSIENYYQEIGRAGRDNLNSNIFLLYDYRDKDIQEYFIESNNPKKEQVEILYDAICDYGNIALGFINDKPIIIDKNLSSLFELKDLSNAIVESCLNVLSISGYIKLINQFKKDFFVKILLSQNKLYNYLKNESSQEEKDLIALLIKMYSNSIFNKHQKILIENISLTLESNSTSIFNLLNKLYNEGIIDLIIPSNNKSISLLLPRVRSKDLKLNLDKINNVYKHSKNKLNKMTEYVFTDNCRMKFIINYFGQTDNNYKCNKCDNCLSNESSINISNEYLQEIIIKTLEEFQKPIKIHLLIKILKGKAINNLTNISTFGTCEHFSTKELESTIDEIVSRNLIIKHEDTLKLNDKSYDSILQIEDNSSNENDLELYNKLRNIRTEAANKFNQPFYLICPDDVLIKISKIKPNSYSELLSIEGFNQRIFNKIGEAILEEIKNYEKGNDKFSKTLIDMIKRKYSFEEIVSLTKIPETILALKIISLIEFDKHLDYSNLISKKEFCLINEKYNEGFYDLKELFNKLDKKISYNKIKIAIKIIESN